MRTISWLWLGTVAFALLSAAGGARAEEKKNQSRMPSRASAEPGPVHQQMSMLAGEWTTVTKMRMGPDAKPQESEGKATLSMILDGRFLRDESTGKFMGRDVKSLKIYGYNTEARRFEGVWMYTQSNAIMTLTGTTEDDGKTVNWAASVEGPGGKMDFRIVTRVQDEDHFTVEMHAKGPDGKDISFETVYTRKK